MYSGTFNDTTMHIHTRTYSFNQLDLPQYETYDKLKQMLLIAVRECPEGFGFA